MTKLNSLAALTVHDTKVRMDIINGEIVYTAPGRVAPR